MTVPRSQTVIQGQPGVFHCYTRCVRRGFLCGYDAETGQSYEHRRQWIVDRFNVVSQIFAVDIYSYAVMENHYHVVLKVDPTRVEEWTDEEVILRWSKVFSWRNKAGKPTKGPVQPTPEQLAIWRDRLGSLSWIMRSINEPIARWSNTEDDVTGHFWEGRFKSLPILDEGGLVACMCYADLNPIRANIATDPATSDFTSISHRIVQMNLMDDSDDLALTAPLGPVFSSHTTPTYLSMTTGQYIELVYATAADEIYERSECRQVLDRLKLSIDSWSHAANHVMELFHTAIGSADSYDDYAESMSRSRDYDAAGRISLFESSAGG